MATTTGRRPSDTARIELDDRGRGWIEGTGTRVAEVVRDHLAPRRWSAEEIQAQRPHLTLGQINAALGFYLAHRDEVDAEMRKADEEYLRLRAATENRGLQDRLRTHRQTVDPGRAE